MERIFHIMGHHTHHTPTTPCVCSGDLINNNLPHVLSFIGNLSEKYLELLKNEMCVRIVSGPSDVQNGKIKYHISSVSFFCFEFHKICINIILIIGLTSMCDYSIRLKKLKIELYMILIQSLISIDLNQIYV